MIGNEIIFLVIFILIGHVIAGIYFTYRVLHKSEGPALPEEKVKDDSATTNK
jgi:uncharacterized protein YneF (UPF0154 family)